MGNDESENLKTHVAVCHERYKGIQKELNELKKSMSKIQYLLGVLMIVLIANGEGPVTELLMKVIFK